MRANVRDYIKEGIFRGKEIDQINCRQKRRYYSKGAAKAAASLNKRFGCPAVRVYKCPSCGAFHLTKQGISKHA